MYWSVSFSRVATVDLAAMSPSHDEERGERRGSATIASLKDSAGGQVEFHAEEPALKSDQSSGEELHVRISINKNDGLNQIPSTTFPRLRA